MRGKEIVVVDCAVSDRVTTRGEPMCAHFARVGCKGRVERTEPDHVLIRFENGEMEWLPSFHVEAVGK